MKDYLYMYEKYNDVMDVSLGGKLLIPALRIEYTQGVNFEIPTVWARFWLYCSIDTISDENP